LDSDEEGEDGIYADANIPDEIHKVKELLNIVPDEVDRKFDTLTRAIDSIRHTNHSEKFVIFTQYVETLNFLKEKLENIYGINKVALIKGGPIDDKIEAKEKFWDEDGAQFLICTSAGGEGINLQVGHILFNYDLPWNPMAVEQRIGRIHRYGQNETSQVYNLVAEDTVEEKIYQLLNNKLREIAAQIGKLDPFTGEPVEDFRSDILGFMGSSPNYLDWYKHALVHKDYTRTEREIEEAMQKAVQSIEALKNLTMDMTSFNLQDYLNIEGKFSLQNLKTFVEAAILRLGGSIVPKGDFFSLITPKPLSNFPNVSAKYDLITFDRDLAMRKRQAELMGLGHPLIDAIIQYCQKVTTPGDVTNLPRSEYDVSDYVVVNTQFSIDLEGSSQHKEIKTVRISNTGDVQILPNDWLLNRLEKRQYNGIRTTAELNWQNIKSNYEGAVGAILSQIKSSVENPVGASVRLLGITLVK
jgi:hypothetical protein